MSMNLNKLQNTFVIGDVHGCYNTLIKLIKQFPHDADIIFVGDLCDKGEFSKDVLEFVIENNYLCVKGNHEALFEKHIKDVINNNKYTLWSSDEKYGGLQCIRSYNGNFSLINKHLKWIKKLPIYLQIDKYFITHGFALEYYQYRDNQDYFNDILLSRLYPDMKEVESKENIINVFGHCFFSEVQIGKKYICLDTGCVSGGKLSALQLGTNKIFEEPMDKKDSKYQIKELKLKDINLDQYGLKEIQKITLKDNCQYSWFDIISNEVIEYILNNYPNVAKYEILRMKEKGIIFPKQINKLLN